MADREIKTTIAVDNNEFEFQCITCQGQKLDTTVRLNGTFFCCITWDDKEKFIEDFRAFMAKHRI